MQYEYIYLLFSCRMMAGAITLLIFYYCVKYRCSSLVFSVRFFYSILAHTYFIIGVWAAE